MATINGKEQGFSPAALIADFEPLSWLWKSDKAPYPSEHSARWAIRSMAAELAAANAVGIHRNRMMIHPERFVRVLESRAIQEFAKRASRL